MSSVLISGHIGVLKINDGTSLKAVSSQTTDLQLQGERLVGTYNVLNSTHTKTSVGPRSTTLTGNVIRTTGSDDAFSIFHAWHLTAGVLRDVECFDPDETTGARKYAGKARLQSWTMMGKTANSGEVQSHAFTLVFEDMTETTITP